METKTILQQVCSGAFVDDYFVMEGHFSKGQYGIYGLRLKTGTDDFVLIRHSSHLSTSIDSAYEAELIIREASRELL